MKQIPLTQGKVALVNDQDFEWLNQWKWYALKKTHSTYYAIRRKGAKSVKMHREILGLTDPTILVDHADGNGLNNQRKNLRIATPSQNAANRRPIRKGYTSRFIGVHWHKRDKKWVARISNGHIGNYDNEIDAAIAFNESAKKIYGEFAVLNPV